MRYLSITCVSCFGSILPLLSDSDRSSFFATLQTSENRRVMSILPVSCRYFMSLYRSSAAFFALLKSDRFVE